MNVETVGTLFLKQNSPTPEERKNGQNFIVLMVEACQMLAQVYPVRHPQGTQKSMFLELIENMAESGCYLSTQPTLIKQSLEGIQKCLKDQNYVGSQLNDAAGNMNGQLPESTPTPAGENNKYVANYLDNNMAHKKSPSDYRGQIHSLTESTQNRITKLTDDDLVELMNQNLSVLDDIKNYVMLNKPSQLTKEYAQGYETQLEEFKKVFSNGKATKEEIQDRLGVFCIVDEEISTKLSQFQRDQNLPALKAYFQNDYGNLIDLVGGGESRQQGSGNHGNVTGGTLPLNEKSRLEQENKMKEEKEKQLKQQKLKEEEEQRIKLLNIRQTYQEEEMKKRQLLQQQQEQLRLEQEQQEQMKAVALAQERKKQEEDQEQAKRLEEIRQQKIREEEEQERQRKQQIELGWQDQGGQQDKGDKNIDLQPSQLKSNYYQQGQHAYSKSNQTGGNITNPPYYLQNHGDTITKGSSSSQFNNVSNSRFMVALNQMGEAEKSKIRESRIQARGSQIDLGKSLQSQSLQKLDPQKNKATISKGISREEHLESLAKEISEQERLKKIIQTNDAALAQQSNTITGLNQELSEKETQIDHLEKEILKNQQKLKDLTQGGTTLEQQYQQQNNELVSQNKVLTSQIVGLNYEIARLKEMNSELSNRNQELDNKDKDYGSIQGQLKANENINRQLQEKNIALEGDVKRYEVRVEQLRVEGETFKQETEKLKRQNQDQVIMINQLQDSIRDQALQNDKAKQINDKKWQEQIASLEVRIQEKINQNNKLEQLNQKQKNEYSAMLQQRDTEIERLNDKIMSAECELVSDQERNPQDNKIITINDNHKNLELKQQLHGQAEFQKQQEKQWKDEKERYLKSIREIEDQMRQKQIEMANEKQILVNEKDEKLKQIQENAMVRLAQKDEEIKGLKGEIIQIGKNNMQQLQAEKDKNEIQLGKLNNEINQLQGKIKQLQDDIQVERNKQIQNIEINDGLKIQYDQKIQDMIQEKDQLIVQAQRNIKLQAQLLEQERTQAKQTLDMERTQAQQLIGQAQTALLEEQVISGEKGKQLEKVVSQLNERDIQLASAKEGIQKLNVQLETQGKECEQEIDDLKEAVEKLRAEVDRLVKEKEHIQEENQMIQQENTVLKNKNGSYLLEDVVRLQEVNEQLQNRIKELMNDNSQIIDSTPTQDSRPRETSSMTRQKQDKQYIQQSSDPFTVPSEPHRNEIIPQEQYLLQQQQQQQQQYQQQQKQPQISQQRKHSQLSANSAQLIPNYQQQQQHQQLYQEEQIAKNSLKNNKQETLPYQYSQQSLSYQNMLSPSSPNMHPSSKKQQTTIPNRLIVSPKYFEAQENSQTIPLKFASNIRSLDPESAALIFPFSNPVDYFSNKLRKQPKGQLIQSDLSVFGPALPDNAQKLYKLQRGCLKESFPLFNNEELQIGVISKLLEDNNSNEGLNKILQLQVYYTSNSMVPIEQFSVQYAAGNSNTLELDQEISHRQINPGEQILQNVFVSFTNIPFELIEAQIVYKLNGKQRDIRVCLPNSLNKYLEPQDIDVQTFKQLWSSSKHQIYRSGEILLDEKIAKSAYDLMNYFGNLMEINETKQEDYKLGLSQNKVAGMFILRGAVNVSFLVKCSITPNSTVIFQLGLVNQQLDLLSHHVLEFVIQTLTLLFAKHI